MEYLHINEKSVSGEDKKNGRMIRFEGEKYHVIGFELYTNNFIVEYPGSAGGNKKLHI